jgi:hypothetical protein
MEIKIFEHWLKEYGRCWENKDPKSFSELFSVDIKYYWTPFEKPKTGRNEVAKAVEEAISTQSGIEFNFKILNVNGNKSIAHWWCSFTRITTGNPIKLDGILTVEMNEKNLCEEFREWWHKEGE